MAIDITGGGFWGWGGDVMLLGPLIDDFLGYRGWKVRGVCLGLGVLAAINCFR